VNESASAPAGARRTAARRVTLAVGTALCVVVVRAMGERWPPARELLAARGTGWVALAALLLSLCATPLGRLGARLERGAEFAAAMPVLRRALGIASAWLALLHAGVSWLGTLRFAMLPLWTWPHLRAGLVALCVLLVLLLTSFGAVVVRLRLGFWKQLHALSYVAALLVLQHTLLSPFAPRALLLATFCAVFVLGLARCV
jgi:DMSO/TMAO reductase YedYZ heme-binding membrane subunit